MTLNVNGDFEFLGIEKSVNRKTGEMYSFICLLQGFDTIKIFGNTDTLLLFNGFEKLDKINCDLSISIGPKTYINVLEVKSI